MQTKKDFIKQKYKHFMNVLIDKSLLTREELENEPDIRDFKNLTEEDILKFGLSTLYSSVVGSPRGIVKQRANGSVCVTGWRE